MAGGKFTYRGYEVTEDYYGNWSVYRPGKNTSDTTRPSKEDAKRWIDKQLKKEN